MEPRIRYAQTADGVSIGLNAREPVAEDLFDPASYDL